MNTYLLHYGVKGMKWGENIFGDEDEIARRTIRGEFGNGEERKRQLGEHYSQIQSRVNQIMKGGSSSSNSQIDDMAYKVISGQFGNGEERKKLLGEQYQEVQARVNEILKNQETVIKLVNGTAGDVSDATKKLGKDELEKAIKDQGERMIDVTTGAPEKTEEEKAREEMKNELREELKKEIMEEMGIDSSSTGSSTKKKSTKKKSTKKKASTKKEKDETDSSVEEEEEVKEETVLKPAAKKASSKKEEPKKETAKKAEIKSYNIERSPGKASSNVSNSSKKTTSSKKDKPSAKATSTKSIGRALKRQEKAVNKIKKEESGTQVKDNRALNMRGSLRKSSKTKKEKTRPKSRKKVITRKGGGT